MTRIYAIAAVAAIVLLSLGIWLTTMGRGEDDQYAQCRASKIAGGSGQIGGPFTLVDETGATVTEQGRDRRTLAPLFRLYLLPRRLPLRHCPQCRGGDTFSKTAATG